MGRALLLGLIGVLACGGKETGPRDGVIKDGIYRNDYLRFSVGIPERWEVEKPPVQGGRFLANYIRLLATGNSRATAETASEFSYVLVSARSEPFALMGDRDLVFTAAAVVIGQRSRPVSRGSDFFYASSLVLNAMNLPYEVLGTSEAVRLGGSFFDVQRLRVRVAGQYAYHALYATPRSGHAIIFEITAKSEKGLKAADSVLQTIRFDNPLY